MEGIHVLDKKLGFNQWSQKPGPKSQGNNMMKLSLINGKMRKDKGCIVSFQKAELFHLKDSPLCAIDYFFPSFLVLTYFFSLYYGDER